MIKKKVIVPDRIDPAGKRTPLVLKGFVKTGDSFRETIDVYIIRKTSCSVNYHL